MNRYGVILCDPPWAYTQFHDRGNGSAAANYTTQKAPDIRSIPVADWAAKDCVLAMWATMPKLDEAVDLMRHWGFTHKTACVWLKSSPSSRDLSTGVGIWFQGVAEFVLFGTRGKPGNFKKRRGKLGVLVGDHDAPAFWKRVGERAPHERMLIAPKPTQHSRKPDNLHEYLETFDGPYLELFARRFRRGWDCWGYDLGQELGPWGVRDLAEVPGQRGLF